MNEKIMVLMVSCSPYSFNDEHGVHREGDSYKVYLAHFKEGAKMPHFVEIAKCTKQEGEKAFENIGKMFDGSVLYDRFGRFCGISCGG